MNLIDILIEKDIQWPDGAAGAVQDGDGEVKFYVGEKPIFDNGGVWLRDSGVDLKEAFYLQTASDYHTTMITKQEWENRKMSKAMFADVQVGDYVWDSRKGWGNVDEVVHSSHFPIRVDFGHDSDAYTLDGYYSIDDVHPSLFWGEIELKAPPKPLPKLEVDTRWLFGLMGETPSTVTFHILVKMVFCIHFLVVRLASQVAVSQRLGIIGN